MAVTSAELIEARREEIVNACESLYETMSFKEITLGEIGRLTSFGRTSIYNYFSAKEEIFLALLQREYDRWTNELEEIAKGSELSRPMLAEALAHSLERRRLMLKLLAMNMYDIEDNSSHEKLCEFKRSYSLAVTALDSVLRRHCTDMSSEDRNGFIYSLLPFMFGIYPYIYATDKQKRAMDDIGFKYPSLSIYELALSFADNALKEKTNGR